MLTKLDMSVINYLSKKVIAMHDFHRKGRQLHLGHRWRPLQAGVNLGGQETHKCRKNVHGVDSPSPERPQIILGTYFLVFIHLYRKARGQKVTPSGMQASSSREKKEPR